MSSQSHPARRSVAIGVVALVMTLAAGCLRLEPPPGTVALTFDDGPHPEWTPQVLDILEFLDIPATFFVVGDEVERYPELVAEMVRLGHSVQNHSATHPDLTTLGDAAVRDELRSTNDAIVAAGAGTPGCLRPPYGAYDQRIASLAEAEGLEMLLWDVDTRDWASPGVPAIVDAVTLAGDQDVILLHDGSGDRSQTVAALPEIIVELDAMGYAFETICVEP